MGFTAMGRTRLPSKEPFPPHTVSNIGDEVHLRARSHLTSLRSIIRSDHTHYTRSETKIKEMSESDPIALFYILEKSRNEIVTLANLERD